MSLCYSPALVLRNKNKQKYAIDLQFGKFVSRLSWLPNLHPCFWNKRVIKFTHTTSKIQFETILNRLRRMCGFAKTKRSLITDHQSVYFKRWVSAALVVCGPQHSHYRLSHQLLGWPIKDFTDKKARLKQHGRRKQYDDHANAIPNLFFSGRSLQVCPTLSKKSYTTSETVKQSICNIYITGARRHWTTRTNKHTH